MHIEVLKPPQIDLLPFLKSFNESFYLAGGTAIALHIGHRYSLDFDLFCYSGFNATDLKNTLKRNNLLIQQVLSEDGSQLDCIVEGVKLTFLHFPYQVVAECDLQDVIKIPDLLTLAAMKAFALGGRGKWKDYVDLYHIFKHYYRLSDVANQAGDIFGKAFSEKLFRQQLAYFDDISFEEEVEYVLDPISQDEIKTFMKDVSLTPF